MVYGVCNYTPGNHMCKMSVKWNSFLRVQFWGLVEVFNYILGNHTCKMGATGVGLVKLIRVQLLGIVQMVSGFN